MSLKNAITNLHKRLDALDTVAVAGQMYLEDYLMKPPAALIGTPYAMLRDAGDLLPTLLDLPAKIARDVILLLRGIDAASAAGLWQVTAAPLELNRIAQRITAADLDIWQANHDGDALPAWAADRLDALDIANLLATAWDQPFGELETMRDALQRLDREMSADQ